MDALMIALWLQGIFQYMRDRGTGLPRRVVLTRYQRWAMRATARGIQP